MRLVRLLILTFTIGTFGLHHCLPTLGQNTPTADPCATDLLIHTQGGTTPPPTSAYESIVLWTRNVANPTDPSSSQYSTVWKSIPVQQGFEYALQLGTVPWFTVLIGTVGSGWGFCDWESATPDQVLTAELTDDGLCSVQPHPTGESCHTNYGGPVGSICFTVTCASGNLCRSHPITVWRSDQSGSDANPIANLMEAYPIDLGGGQAIFLLETSKVMIGFDQLGSSVPGTIVNDNVRKNSVPFYLNSYYSPTVLACNQQQTPLPTTVLIDIPTSTAIAGAPLDPHGAACGQNAIPGAPTLPSVLGCTTVIFNYTVESAAQEKTGIAVWINPLAFEQPNPPTSATPVVWKTFDWNDQMVSFAVERDYYLGLIQFPSVDRDSHEYILSPLIYSAPGDVWQVGADASGMGVFTRLSTGTAPNVTITLQAGSTFLTKQSYICLWKGGSCVQIISTIAFTTTVLAYDSLRIFFRGDNGFTPWVTIQQFDLQLNNSFDLSNIPTGSALGVNTYINGGLFLEQFTPVQSCLGMYCNNHGTCDVTTGQCVCTGGWTGASCDIPTGSSSSSTGATPPAGSTAGPGPTSGPTPTSGGSTGGSAAPVSVSSSSGGSGGSSNGSLPVPLLPGVPWSSGIGLTIAITHITMGIVLPTWSFRAAVGFFQLSALMTHTGLDLPTNIRSLGRQLDLLNFVFRNPGDIDLPTQNDQPSTTITNVTLMMTTNYLGDDTDPSQQQIDDYQADVKANSDLFIVTLLSVLSVIGIGLIVSIILLLIDRGLHGPFNEFEVLNHITKKYEEEQRETNTAKETKKEEPETFMYPDLEDSPDSVVLSPSKSDLIGTGAKGSLVQPSPDLDVDGEPVSVAVSGGEEVVVESKRAFLPTILWFARSNSIAYRLHIRSLPLALTLHLIKLAYYGLSFSSYRHVAWFESDHSTGFISTLAWFVTLGCTIVLPISVHLILKQQYQLLLEQDTSAISRTKYRLFLFRYAALLDGPHRPSQRRFALWLLIKQNLLAAAVGILALNTVQSHQQWSLSSTSATTVQLVMCFIISVGYLIFLCWSQPFASSTVNRLQTVYEVFNCLVLLLLIIYHGVPDIGFIDLVLVINIFAACISFLIFAVMIYEVSRPYHDKIKKKADGVFNCWKSSKSLDDDLTTTSGGDVPELSPADSSISDASVIIPAVVSPLASALFPDLNDQLVESNEVGEAQSPPPLPVRRRPKKSAAAPESNDLNQPFLTTDTQEV